MPCILRFLPVVGSVWKFVSHEVADLGSGRDLDPSDLGERSVVVSALGVARRGSFAHSDTAVNPSRSSARRDEQARECFRSWHEGFGGNVFDG